MMAAQPQQPLNDPYIAHEITPKDSVSKLEFNPVADFLAVGSWDATVKIYQVDGSSGQSIEKATVPHEGPVLGVAWSKDGTKLLSCSTDKSCKLFDLASGAAPTQIAGHEGPISCVRWIEMPGPAGGPGQGIAVTASWDKTVKYWDMRQNTPIAQIQAPERVYAMDSCGDILVYGTADRQVSIVDLRNPATPKSTKESTLKMQTRVITCFPAGNGYAIGSVEGRVAIQYVDDKDSAQNFSFKCHRLEPPANQRLNGETNVWAVNAISFNKAHGTFSTAGADGTLSFWDKDQRTRLKTYTQKELNNSEALSKTNPPVPIVATSFSKDSNMFAYAFSYDWSRGQSGAVPTNRTQIMIHGVLQEEIKPKNKAGK